MRDTPVSENTDLPEETVMTAQPVYVPPVAPLEIQPEAEVPLPMEPAAGAKQNRPARVIMTASKEFATAELPEEEVVNAVVTQGPVDNPNVLQQNDHNTIPTSPYTVQESIGIPAKTHMFFLPEQGEKFDERIMALTKRSSLDTVQGYGWNASLMVANALTAQTGMTQTPAIHRDGSAWRQTLETEAGAYGFTSPNYGEEKVPLADGQRARIRIRALMGNGGVITVPMVKSGFWLTMYAPTDSAWYELFRRFNDDKVSYGRSTTGMIFSNEQVYMNSWLLEFCLDHISDATVKYADINELRQLIDALDLPVMFAGMARLMYPRGFNYVRSIGTAEGIDGMRMIQGKLDIAKLLWIDNNYLSPKQRTHMSNRVRSTTTLEQLTNYRNDFVLSQGREIKFSDKISLVLKSPSAENYITDGDRWIEGIVTMVDETFTTTRPTEVERNKVILRHANMAQMMRYASFVSVVRFDGADHVHPEAIENSLRTLSEEPGFVEIFDKELKRFISDSTASMIAIPETAGHDNEQNHPRFPNLIPLDVVTVFFTLLAQKQQK